MKKFIEVKRLFDGTVMHDIIAIDSIKNVYIDLPEGKMIVITINNGYKYKEKYKTPESCLLRFKLLMYYLDVGLNATDMLEDLIDPEQIILTASPIIECKKYRNSILEKLPEDCEDPKQAVVDSVMKLMEDLHDEVEKSKNN